MLHMALSDLYGNGFTVHNGGTSTKFVQLWKKREGKNMNTKYNNNNNYENGIKPFEAKGNCVSETEVELEVLHDFPI